MRITISVEDTQDDQLQYEIERRVRLERERYPAEASAVSAPVVPSVPMRTVKPPKVARKPRKRKR